MHRHYLIKSSQNWQPCKRNSGRQLNHNLCCNLLYFLILLGPRVHECHRMLDPLGAAGAAYSSQRGNLDWRTVIWCNLHGAAAALISQGGDTNTDKSAVTKQLLLRQSGWLYELMRVLLTCRGKLSYSGLTIFKTVKTFQWKDSIKGPFSFLWLLFATGL